LKKKLIGSIFWRFIPRVNDLIDKLGGEMRFSKLENIFFYDLKWPPKEDWDEIINEIGDINDDNNLENLDENMMIDS
jgi:hypothetical protein